MGAVLEEEEEEEGEKSFHICDYSGIGIVRYQVTVNFSVRKRKKKKKRKKIPRSLPSKKNQYLSAGDAYRTEECQMHGARIAYVIYFSLTQLF